MQWWGNEKLVGACWSPPYRDLNCGQQARDIALKTDPDYRRACEKFLNDFDAFTKAFSKAWYKPTHRDMGPREFYLIHEERVENTLLWQDPIPRRDYDTVSASDIAALRQSILTVGLSTSDLVFTALSAAATCRNSDKRGGANGGRLAIAPQKDWIVNRRTLPVIAAPLKIQDNFNSKQTGTVKIWLPISSCSQGARLLRKLRRMREFKSRPPLHQVAAIQPRS